METVAKNRIKELLTEFLSTEGAVTIIEQAKMSNKATWLDTQVKIEVTQSGENSMMFEIRNNSRNGFSEFKQELTIE